MKPYNERLPLIDETVEELRGVMPSFYSGISERDHEFVCTRQEFEQRAKELGYINGYKYGVEYETKGEKPNLPDDVEVEVFNGSHWLVSWSVGNFHWADVDKFRIVDGRYKPLAERKKDAARIAKDIVDSHKQKENTMNNDWYEKGEGMPPVGTVCELIWCGVSQGDIEIIAYRNNGNKVIFWRIDKDHVDAAEIPTAEFRPLRTETDKLVEGLTGNNFAGLVVTKDSAQEIIKAGYRKIKPMSEDEFMRAIIPYFGMKNWSGDDMHRICMSLRSAYKSGLRFVKGDVK